MKKYLLVTVVLCSLNLKADDGLISLENFIKKINNNKIFISPKRPKLPTPAYSVISLSQKENPRQIKALQEIPLYVLNNFIKWTNIIVKKQYINRDIAKQTIALPNIVLFSNRTKSNAPVFTWKSDILLIRNNSKIKSYSWDTGTFFVLCFIKANDNFANKSQVRKYVESLLSKYTNFPNKKLNLYTFEAVKTNGIWKGKYSIPRKNYYSWKKFTEFIIGGNFSCFFFAEKKEGVPTVLRARPGDLNRF